MALALMLEAREVDRSIGRRAIALRLPDHLAQAFGELVQGGVLVAARGAQTLEMRAHTPRLVDSDLLGDGKVQRQMQERIDRARFRRKVLVQMAFGIVEDSVVFGVQRDQARGDCLELRKGRCRSETSPSCR